MLDRKRRIDVEKLSIEDITSLTDSISKKISNITEKAVDDANKILNIYGMKAKMQIAIEHINNDTK